MQRLNINQDIKPLSEVRTGIASFIKQVHNTKRPVVITQRGKGVAVSFEAGTGYIVRPLSSTVVYIETCKIEKTKQSVSG